MQSISPVFTESEVQFEHKVAEHQNEYMTIVGLPVSLQLVDRATGKSTIVNPWGMSFRFRLSDEERAAVAAGSDLILTQLNFGKEVTPMNVQFCAEGVRPFFGETPAITQPIEMNATMIDEARIPSAAEANGPQLVNGKAQGDGFTE